jgi:hypothetical protein
LSRGQAEGGASPVQMAQVVRRPASPEARGSVPNGAVWVELHGARVVVPPGAGRATVMTVLEALKAAASGGAR